MNAICLREFVNAEKSRSSGFFKYIRGMRLFAHDRYRKHFLCNADLFGDLFELFTVRDNKRPDQRHGNRFYCRSPEFVINCHCRARREHFGYCRDHCRRRFGPRRGPRFFIVGLYDALGRPGNKFSFDRGVPFLCRPFSPWALDQVHSVSGRGRVPCRDRLALGKGFVQGYVRRAAHLENARDLDYPPGIHPLGAGRGFCGHTDYRAQAL